ncbi:hypothetical protein FLL45_10305 [Aliikangiella marina]|uniref:Flagellar hook-associated protein 2 n=1 Tax=Aliikangiella marina TaxID=1712262 RepID=A0A545TDR5_9GAMM|nr:flagellar filament capping protein FliD [Aliikangiella marina]TQV75316.1 hypothetical protein FLL45_10305 [Aliikangiella marina]
MGLITAAGLGSGIDVESIIAALVNAERAPKESSLARLEVRTNVEISGVGQLKSSLSALQDSLENLNEENFNARTATSADDTQLTAVADGNSSEGEFDVTIVQTATITELSTSTIAGDSSTVLGTGNLTFQNANSDSFVINVGASDSLLDIVDAINTAADNFGVTATLVNGDSGTKIIYRGSDTGAINDFSVTNDNANLAAISDGNGGTLNQDSTALDAQITIAGLTISSETNTFQDPVRGVDITLADDAVAGTVTVSVLKDPDTVKSNIEQFVEDYNSFIATVNALGSATEGAEGALLGDATLRNIRSSISSILSSEVASITTDFNSLSRVGLRTQKDGTLQINASELESALDSAFSDVGNIFYAADGLGTQLEAAIDPYTEFSGLLDSRTDSLQSTLTRIADDRDQLDFRIAQLEFSLRKKFAATDTIVSSFNFTGSFLEQQFSALSGQNE